METLIKRFAEVSEIIPLLLIIRIFLFLLEPGNLINEMMKRFITSICG